jgi:hypothetical protein
MKRIKILFLAIATVLALNLQAQTVDEIINKHVDAIGGKEKLGQVKSVYFESTLEVMGNQAPVTEYLLEGKGFKSVTDFNGSSIIQCYTDKGGWQVNPMAGIADPQVMSNDMYQGGKTSIYVGGALHDYAAKGYKAELAGKDGGNYKIKLTDSGGESTYFIDTATYFVTKAIVKGEAMGQPADLTSTFSDYKKTDFGIVLPYSFAMDLGAFSLAFSLKKVEVNKEIDPKIFEMSK